MTQPYSVAATWSNKQGVHDATLRFQPSIVTRPGCVGISLTEELTHEKGGDRHMACIVLDRPLALQWHRHFALVLEDPMVPASALKEALDALDDLAKKAALEQDHLVSWDELGTLQDRLGKYLPT